MLQEHSVTYYFVVSVLKPGEEIRFHACFPTYPAGALVNCPMKYGEYRECSWSSKEDGSGLAVVTKPGDDQKAYKSAILSKFPNRKALVEALFPVGRMVVVNDCREGVQEYEYINCGEFGVRAAYVSLNGRSFKEMCTC